MALTAVHLRYPLEQHPWVLEYKLPVHVIACNQTCGRIGVFSTTDITQVTCKKCRKAAGV